jgi:hypothetical protein
MEGGLLARPQRADQRDCFGESRLALRVPWPVANGRVVVQRLARADREVRAIRRQARQSGSRLGHDGRVIPQDGRSQSGAQHDAAGPSGRRA